MFALARHPGVAQVGVFPAGAMEHQRSRGWYRISEYRPEPGDFYLPDFVDAFTDLDAEPDQPEDRPAEPEKDEES